MTKRRGKDAKPRLTPRRRRRTGHMASVEQRQRAQLNAIKLRTIAKTTGEVILTDRGPSGLKSGVVYGTTGPKGGAAAPPSTAFAYRLRKLLKPIQIAPVIIRNDAGQIIGHVVTDPVTGRRSRTDVPGRSR